MPVGSCLTADTTPCMTPRQVFDGLPRCLTHGSTQPGWVYCIRDDASDAVKIGFSRNPHRRLRQMQTASPRPLRMLACVPSVRAFEQFVHWAHRDRRIAGEWFDDGDGSVSTTFCMMAEDWQ